MGTANMTGSVDSTSTDANATEAYIPTKKYCVLSQKAQLQARLEKGDHLDGDPGSRRWKVFTSHAPQMRLVGVTEHSLDKKQLIAALWFEWMSASCAHVTAVDHFSGLNPTGPFAGPTLALR